MKRSKYIEMLMLSVLVLSCSEQSKFEQGELSNNNATNYVGDKACVECHPSQVALWQNSHHDLAMQVADETTVLGDFNDTIFDYFGEESKFYQKDNRYYVRTIGSDGGQAEFSIDYTFGVYPLQQYLIKFPKGRYQVLNIAWDARSKQVGGQRWFHLYPNEYIKHNDELHWSGINQNWNFMCADCHSTNLKKNYNIETKEYNTAWSSIDVSCEACHGPASRHIAWAASELPDKKNSIRHKGFSFLFDRHNAGLWEMNINTGNAQRKNIGNNKEVEVCAQCHSRRSRHALEVRSGDPFLDNFTPALLSESLYHADGQVDDEVYVYGSFLQSKMYHQGVSCSDCHNPHSLELRASENDLCAQCHWPAKYDTRAHHFHQQGSEGAQCTMCHMPDKLYMVVDARRDHSFRVPRPDLSLKYGVPNACNQCHQDKTAQWSAQVLEEQYGKRIQNHYAGALHAARKGLPPAEELLRYVISDKSQSLIARATAMQHLPFYVSEKTLPLMKQAISSTEPLLRLGLASALNQLPQQPRKQLASSLLFDELLSIRRQATESLLGISLQGLPAEVVRRYKLNLEEYLLSERFNADRPESLLNLARALSMQGQFAQAEQYYRDAILIAPYYSPAYVNLADHYRSLNNDIAGEKVLRQGLLKTRDKTAVQHALGLLLVRQKKYQESMDYLRLAAISETSNVRYQYVYAIALNSLGEGKKALQELERALDKYPDNADIIGALISVNRELGNIKKAEGYERLLKK